MLRLQNRLKMKVLVVLCFKIITYSYIWECKLIYYKTVRRRHISYDFPEQWTFSFIQISTKAKTVLPWWGVLSWQSFWFVSWIFELKCHVLKFLAHWSLSSDPWLRKEWLWHDMKLYFFSGIKMTVCRLQSDTCSRWHHSCDES